MAKLPEFVAFILEQLADVVGVTSNRFFGGTGLSAQGTQFAMMMGNDLYFVVNDATRPKYEKLGSQCFAYDTKTKRVQVKKYFQVPVDVIEDREALVSLARESIDVARKLKSKSVASKAPRAP